MMQRDRLIRIAVLVLLYGLAFALFGWLGFAITAAVVVGLAAAFCLAQRRRGQAPSN